MSSNSHSIEYLDPAAIKPRLHAWRKYPANQIAEAKRQLDLLGMVVEPPLLDDENRVVCGGATVLAAQQLKWSRIPVLRVANLSADELRLYAINAHKLSEMGAYDEAILAQELRELEKLLGQDVLKGLAMEEGEITRLLALGAPAIQDLEPAAIGADAVPISTPGDLWQMAEHRLLCGNSLEAESFATLMGSIEEAYAHWAKLRRKFYRINRHFPKNFKRKYPARFPPFEPAARHDD